MVEDERAECGMYIEQVCVLTVQWEARHTDGAEAGGGHTHVQVGCMIAYMIHTCDTVPRIPEAKCARHAFWLSGSARHAFWLSGSARHAFRRVKALDMRGRLYATQCL
eukprot:359189-Chlamydomonas_euryale.AAC.11